MRRYLARVFELHPLALLAGLLLLPPLTVWLWKLEAHQGAVEREIARQGALTRAMVREMVERQVMPPVRQTVGTVNALPDAVLRLVDRHAARIEDELHVQATALQQNAVAEVRHGVDGALGAVADLRRDAIGQVAGIRGDVAPVIAGAAAVVQRADEAIEPKEIAGVVRDTRFFMARAARTMGHIEQASDDFRGAVPAMLVTWQDIGKQADGVAGNINRLTKPHWYDRLLGYGLNGAVLFRQLHPATNLTLQGYTAIQGAK